MYQDDPAETETFIGAMDSLVKARGDAEVMGKAFVIGTTLPSFSTSARDQPVTRLLSASGFPRFEPRSSI
jgi:hypothetical protein